jgi:hypothetical protein
MAELRPKNSQHRGSPRKDEKTSSREISPACSSEIRVGHAITKKSHAKAASSRAVVIQRRRRRAGKVIRRFSRLTVGRSAASRASAASGPSECEGGESAATPC